MTNTSTLNSVERACADLRRNGQAVTLTAVTAHTGLGRTVLYRDPIIGPQSRTTDTAQRPTAPSPASPTRSPRSTPRSRHWPQASGATKSNSGSWPPEKAKSLTG